MVVEERGEQRLNDCLPSELERVGVALVGITHVAV